MRLLPVAFGLSLSLLMVTAACAQVGGDDGAPNHADTPDHADLDPTRDPFVDAPPPSPVSVPTPRLGPCGEVKRPLDSGLWTVKKIESLKVVNALGTPADPKPVPANRAKLQICPDGAPCMAPDIVLNGAFHARDSRGNPVAVAGATMRDGVLDTGPSSQAYSHRGGVALLSDGRIVICKPSTSFGVTNDVIQSNCASGGAKVVDFMGGGAYLVRKGFKACSGSVIAAPCDREIDLATMQNFRQSGDGIRATQMHSALHGIMAMKDGQAYVVFSKRAVTGAMIQDQLCAAGFDEVLKYDGGSGFIAWGPGVPRPIVGVNPTAFLISTGK